MIVDVIRNRTAIDDADMRSDKASAQPIGNKVAVFHSGTTLDPPCGAYESRLQAASHHLRASSRWAA